MNNGAARRGPSGIDESAEAARRDRQGVLRESEGADEDREAENHASVSDGRRSVTDSHQELTDIMEREHLSEEAKTEMIHGESCGRTDHVCRSIRARRTCGYAH